MKVQFSYENCFYFDISLFINLFDSHTSHFVFLYNLRSFCYKIHKYAHIDKIIFIKCILNYKCIINIYLIIKIFTQNGDITYYKRHKNTETVYKPLKDGPKDETDRRKDR